MTSEEQQEGVTVAIESQENEKSKDCKKEAITWICPRCTLINDDTFSRCQVCEKQRPFPELQPPYSNPHDSKSKSNSKSMLNKLPSLHVDKQIFCVKKDEEMVETEDEEVHFSGGWETYCSMIRLIILHIARNNNVSEKDINRLNVDIVDAFIVPFSMKLSLFIGNINGKIQKNISSNTKFRVNSRNINGKKENSFFTLIIYYQSPIMSMNCNEILIDHEYGNFLVSNKRSKITFGFTQNRMKSWDNAISKISQNDYILIFRKNRKNVNLTVIQENYNDSDDINNDLNAQSEACNVVNLRCGIKLLIQNVGNRAIEPIDENKSLYGIVTIGYPYGVLGLHQGFDKPNIKKVLFFRQIIDIENLNKYMLQLLLFT